MQGSRDKRVAVFEDTMTACRKNAVLRDAIHKTIMGTKLYKPDEHPLHTIYNRPHYKVTVSDRRSFEAAERLHKADPDSRIAVLNFASATNPGGGVKKGSSAQEESLCRISTLFPCLDTEVLHREFYQMHRNRHDVRYTDTCIYLPDIIVFKSDTDVPQMLPEGEWFRADVLTCAAPNLRIKPYNSMNPGSGQAAHLSDAEIQDLHERRGKHLLEIAAANGDNIVVLGAFGCGAFQNPPEIVAKAYRKILPIFSECFREVHFAVFCGKDRTNFNVFADILKDL